MAGREDEILSNIGFLREDISNLFDKNDNMIRDQGNLAVSIARLEECNKRYLDSSEKNINIMTEIQNTQCKHNNRISVIEDMVKYNQGIGRKGWGTIITGLTMSIGAMVTSIIQTAT